jgi:hypothetical protein
MSPAQCRAARAMLDWKQNALAGRAGLGSHMPVFYYEKYGYRSRATGTFSGARYVSNDAIEKMKKAFEGAGMEFIGETGINLRSEK